MNIFQKVTLKTLKENRTRTIAVIIGIILSLSMFTAVTTSVSSFRSYMLEITKAREGNWHGAVSVKTSDKDAFASDAAIESISFLEHIGYARLADCTNPDKPYLFIGGMDENALGTLPLIITEGRMPENENEILIPSHLAYNGQVYYSLNDTLNLTIGKRISKDAKGNDSSLGQNTPYLYTAQEEAEFSSMADADDTVSDDVTETLVPDFSHTYTVVGFYERPSIEDFSAPGYTALTISGDTAAKDAEYTAYLRFRDAKDALPWLTQHYSEHYETNYDLLRIYGASLESSYNAVLYSLATILIVIILFGSISLIYNAFSISVTERTKQFGLLASLGATRKQLIHSVLFEAFCLCVIGIPLGILAGLAGIGITFSLLGTSISDVLWGDWAAPLTLHVSPTALLVAVLIGLFTVLISAYLPAHRSSRLSPIDAIRQTSDIAIRPGKVKTSRLTYRLFGLSGMLASKNFKRNRKKYRATVVSLFVSIVLFISASSFCSYLITGAESVMSDAGFDITYHKYGDSNNLSNDEIFNRLISVNGITNAAWSQYQYSRIYVDRTALSQEYLDLLSELWADESNASSPQKQQQIFLDVQINFINDDTYRAYLKAQGLPADLFMNPQRPIAVASDFLRSYNGDTGKYSTMHVLNSNGASATLLQRLTPEGYEFTGYYSDENNNLVYFFDNLETGETIEVPAFDCTTDASVIIGSVQDDVPFFLGSSYGSGLTLFYPVSVMAAVLGSDESESLTDSYADFYFTATDHKSAAADISESLKNMGLNGDSVYDYAANAAQERTLLMIITVFSYGFITLISLIAVANVFNTISTNIRLRKREFAMLKSTGMTPMGFRIMMCYECLLYGIKSLIYGLPVSIAVTFWIYRGISSGWEAGFYIPWYSLIISIGSVFLVVGSTMIYSMRKIGKENIMDNLKNDTV